MASSIMKRVLPDIDHNDCTGLSPAAGLMFLLESLTTAEELKAFPRDIDVVRHLLTNEEVMAIACHGAAKMMAVLVRDERRSAS